MNEAISANLTALCGKPIQDASNQELYLSLLRLVEERAEEQVRPVTGRKLYYISAEFLIGKLLSNNLINLGLYDDVRDCRAGAELARSKRLLGLILLGGCFDYTPEQTATLDIPFVCCLFTNSFGSLKKSAYSSVSIDDQAEARRAVEVLIRQGHNRI